MVDRLVLWLDHSELEEEVENTNLAYKAFRNYWRCFYAASCSALVILVVLPAINDPLSEFLIILTYRKMGLNALKNRNGDPDESKVFDSKPNEKADKVV